MYLALKLFAVFKKTWQLNLRHQLWFQFERCNWVTEFTHFFFRKRYEKFTKIANISSLMQVYWLPGTILGPKGTAVNKIKFLIPWKLLTGRRLGKCGNLRLATRVIFEWLHLLKKLLFSQIVKVLKMKRSLLKTRFSSCIRRLKLYMGAWYMWKRYMQSDHLELIKGCLMGERSKWLKLIKRIIKIVHKSIEGKQPVASINTAFIIFIFKNTFLCLLAMVCLLLCRLPLVGASGVPLSSCGEQASCCGAPLS